ncbi:MAG: hypothetical protein HF967_07425 [Methanosarcinales archaeon]|jgi:hypothetical protein|nr:hypothetical protein [Methanosarcinales archaeon]
MNDTIEIKSDVGGIGGLINGDFVILRSGDLNFTVEEFTKGLLPSVSIGNEFMTLFYHSFILNELLKQGLKQYFIIRLNLL